MVATLFIAEAAGAATVGTGASLFVASAEGAATSSGGATLFVAEAQGTTIADSLLTVDLGPDLTDIEPYTQQTVTATVANGPAADLTIEVTLGPAVLLFGPGPVWTYTTPGSVAGGVQLRFRVTATPPSGALASAEVTHWINPNTIGYGNTLGQLVSAFTTTTGT